ncbi:protein-tyrosine phosphatase-like protein [Cunninghamella echinulata]|nr:protein-tyrosine phosphatase-like protein [Cunninghamella echinulata]
MYKRSADMPGVGHRLINPPTLIEYNNTRFLIVDAPSTNNLPLYIQEFQQWHVTDVVRCCEPTYPKEPLSEKGIQVHDLVFSDGASPPSSIVDAWLSLIDERFHAPMNKNKNNYRHDDDGHIDDKNNNESFAPPTIASHCLAGLGRAPVLVAIALIEEGMPALDAVAYIRERRKGAINNKQLKFIESYKPRSKKQCIIS